VAGSAAFFDLDKTIIATSSTLAFGRTFFDNGLIGRQAVLRGAYARFVYALGRADGDRMARMRDDLARLVAGWEVRQVTDIVDEALHDLIQPMIYAEAVALITEHRAAGRAIVIVSSSGEEVVGPIGELLGADHVVATRLVRRDGRYTGDIAFYAAGPNKAVAMRELAAEQGWDLSDCYAYSDSTTDLPMLSAVGHPVAVNPERGLRRAATANDWPIRRFAHPIPLRRRLPSVSTPTAAGVAGIAVAAVIGRGLVKRHAQR
jgi:HAD superfamily hydrolase (TIGR01490 family)